MPQGSESFTTAGLLPDPLPENPFPTLAAWLDEAWQKRITPNPNAMVLATLDAENTPQTRVVLCKGMDVEQGRLTFYTNYTSRKGKALEANPRASVTFHWDALGRQAGVSGPVIKATPEESDAYFASRPVESKLGAWASQQSQPIESREALLMQVVETMTRFGLKPADALPEQADIPRPPHWGGFHIVASRVELWLSGEGRVHERAAWTRTAAPSRVDSWNAVRLQP